MWFWPCVLEIVTGWIMSTTIIAWDVYNQRQLADEGFPTIKLSGAINFSLIFPSLERWFVPKIPFWLMSFGSWPETCLTLSCSKARDRDGCRVIAGKGKTRRGVAHRNQNRSGKGRTDCRFRKKPSFQYGLSPALTPPSRPCNPHQPGVPFLSDCFSQLSPRGPPPLL